MTQDAIITCPQCGFSRNVSTSRIPGGRVIATCPKCGCRFRLATEKEQLGDNADSEEDIRLTASKAYQREADRFARTDDKAGEANGGSTKPAQVENPWELAPAELDWVSAFIQTSIRVMFSATAFFGGLKPRQSQIRPLIFYVIIGAFQTIMEKVWIKVFYAMFEPAAATDPELGKMFAMLAPDSDLILPILLRCGLLVAQIYFFSFLIFTIYKLVRPQTASFSLVFQVFAYSAAPSLLCVVPFLGSIAGMIWGLGCLAVGCKIAMRLSWGQTLLGFLPVLLFLAPFIQTLFSMTAK